MPIAFRRSLVASVLAVIATVPGLRLTAQSLTLPPSGDNQKASVSQWIGPVELSITYHSPDVTAPNGQDRRGKIWGELVPWGYANLGFGTCGDKCPWRGGDLRGEPSGEPRPRGAGDRVTGHPRNQPSVRRAPCLPGPAYRPEPDGRAQGPPLHQNGEFERRFCVGAGLSPPAN